MPDRPSRAGNRNAGHGSVRLEVVEGRRALNRFIRVPWAIYSDDPMWVPPLMFERRQHLSASNPYFEHAKFRAWIAHRDGKPVGRVSAQVDKLHLERYHDATGFFGMLEAEDRPETFQALLGAAQDWLREQGMRRIRGPFSLSINDESGLLVEGFDTPPQIMMGHARPYYGARVEEQGFDREKDLLAYYLDVDFEPARVTSVLKAKVGSRVRLRPLRRSQLKEELEIIRDIFEDAWSENWGFIPFTPAELEHLGQNLKLLVSDEFVQIAEVDGVPAAMLVAFPNINESIRDLNGRILPFGWLKLLWRLKVRHPKMVRVPLMGVRRRHQNRLMGAALAFMVIEAVRAAAAPRGVTGGELSWILDDNKGMQKMLETLGGVAYKRYRVYLKELIPERLDDSESQPSNDPGNA